MFRKFTRSSARLLQPRRLPTRRRVPKDRMYSIRWNLNPNFWLPTAPDRKKGKLPPWHCGSPLAMPAVPMDGPIAVCRRGLVEKHHTVGRANEELVRSSDL